MWDAEERVGQVRGQIVDGGLVARWAGAEVLIGEGTQGTRDLEIVVASAGVTDVEEHVSRKLMFDVDLELRETSGPRILIEEADGVAYVGLRTKCRAGRLYEPVGKRIGYIRDVRNPVVEGGNEVGGGKEAGILDDVL